MEAFNIGFQYKLPHGGTVEADYVGKFSRKLTIPFDQNPAITDCSGGFFQANPILYGNRTCGGTAANTQASNSQRARYPQFNTGGGGLVDFASIGTANYNALQTEYTQRGGKYLTMIMSYTYSKSFDLMSDGTTQAGGSSQIPNPFNVSSERGLSDFDARHIFALGWSYDLPKLHRSYAVVRSIVNNWNYSGIYSAHTGAPLNVTCGCDQLRLMLNRTSGRRSSRASTRGCRAIGTVQPRSPLGSTPMHSPIPSLVRSARCTATRLRDRPSSTPICRSDGTSRWTMYGRA